MKLLNQQVYDNVLSKFCKGCSIWESKRYKEPGEYEEWTAKHESVCTANFKGSSQAMERWKEH